MDDGRLKVAVKIYLLARGLLMFSSTRDCEDKIAGTSNAKADRAVLYVTSASTACIEQSAATD